MAILYGPSVDKGFSDHVVIPDDHRYPGDNWRRFRALGNYLLYHKPRVITFLGDSADMASLCSFDKGKREMVFRNVRDDIESYHRGEEEIFKPIVEYNAMRSRNHKSQYHPLLIKIRGNHEYRVQKLLDYEPQWHGSVSMDSFKTRLPLNEIIVPFGEVIEIDGICYSHYFVSGVKGQPASSARALLAKKGCSCTMGHVHTLDTAVLTKPTGELIRGLLAGSFHDPDHVSFAGPQVDKIWWNGFFHKHRVKNGSYDLQEISVDRLIELWDN